MEELQEQIYKRVEKLYVDREKDYGDDWHRFCQLRYLATIDQLWKDHLLAMDHLRQGIGLRGYGQKDPKVEYKKEGLRRLHPHAGSHQGAPSSARSCGRSRATPAKTPSA